MLVMAAKLEAGIPDFRATSPDAKWEKVSSAERGDDDYASIQDFTKEKPSKKTAQARVEAPVKQSRLRAYRVQARRRRRRQRLLLVAAIVVAILYYFVFGFGFGVSGLCPGPSIYLAMAGDLDVIFYHWPGYALGAVLAQVYKDRKAAVAMKKIV